MRCENISGKVNQLVDKFSNEFACVCRNTQKRPTQERLVKNAADVEAEVDIAR